MFWIYLAIFFVVVAMICLFIASGVPPYDDSESRWRGVGVAFFVVAFSFVFISLVKSFNANASQKSDVEKLIKLEQTLAVYEERADSLLKPISNYLAEVYPKHEREIFKMMRPEDIAVYLVKYPEIKTSETLMVLVEQIRRLQESCYIQRLERAEILYEMRYREKNPWVLQFVMPDIEIPKE